MDVFSLTKSKTRRKILDLFITDPLKSYFLREVSRKLSLSVGNVRREFLSLEKFGLFHSVRRGRFVYYTINTSSPFFEIASSMVFQNKSIHTNDIVSEGFAWVTNLSPAYIPETIYCQTRDIFQYRLQTWMLRLEKTMGTNAYLLSAIAGEIGNNSFDHNIGNWPSVPGVFFAHDENRKIIVLADRGQGILKTINRVLPEIRTDRDALHAAFTKTISGRSPEKRGNGLKFVVQILKDKKWSLQFISGSALFEIKSGGNIKITSQKRKIRGCYSVIHY